MWGVNVERVEAAPSEDAVKRQSKPPTPRSSSNSQATTDPLTRTPEYSTPTYYRTPL